MIFHLENGATLEEVLSLPISYTEDLPETKYDRFLKRVERGTAKLSEEELEEHIQKYYTLSNGKKNKWMYDLHPDPRKHFFSQKLQSLKEPQRPDELHRRCFSSFSDSLLYIYHSDFMNILPLHVWRDFIEHFTKEMCHLIDNFDNSTFDVDKQASCDKMVTQLIGEFVIQNGFFNIQSFLNDATLTDFQKIRNIRSFLKCWNGKNPFPPEYLFFEIEHWHFFFHHFEKYCFGHERIELLLSTVVSKIPIQEMKCKLIQTDLEYYRFFGWKKVSVFNLKKELVPLSKSFVNGFFDPTSHFEENIFWWCNKTPYYIFYKEEEGNAALYLQHKEQSQIEKGILNCPIKYIPTFDLEQLHSFCYSKFSCNETWEFLLKTTASVPVEEVLKKCFNVIGRVCNEYSTKHYHLSLMQKLNQQILIRKRLPVCDSRILFPEYYFNDKDTQEKFDTIWEQTFCFFKNQFINFLSNMESNEILYCETIPSFRHPTMDLTLYIGNKDLFCVLEKKKTMIKYFHTKNLFLPPEEEKQEKMSKDYYIKEMDRYTFSLLSSK